MIKAERDGKSHTVYVHIEGIAFDIGYEAVAILSHIYEMEPQLIPIIFNTFKEELEDELCNKTQ